MYVQTIERIEHFTTSQAQTQDSQSTSGEVANLSGRKDRLHWLRAGINAMVRYVIRQQMAAARREIRRGRDRLLIRPDRE